jgi:hypothetical protein
MGGASALMMIHFDLYQKQSGEFVKYFQHAYMRAMSEDQPPCENRNHY